MTASLPSPSPDAAAASGKIAASGTYDDEADPRKVTRRRFDWLEGRVATLERELFLLSRDQVDIEATVKDLRLLVREMRERAAS